MCYLIWLGCCVCGEGVGWDKHGVKHSPLVIIQPPIILLGMLQLCSGIVGVGCCENGAQLLVPWYSDVYPLIILISSMEQCCVWDMEHLARTLPPPCCGAYLLATEP